VKKAKRAPVPSGWLGGTASAQSAAFVPHPEFGFMCPLLKPSATLP